MGKNLKNQLATQLSLAPYSNAHEVLSLYLKERLTQLQPKQAQQLLDLINERINYKIVTNANEKVLKVDWYNSKDRSINITVIERYSESILKVSALIHQIEHAIQHLHTPWTPYNIMDPRYFLVHHFEKEKGAMIAEGAYLLSVSKENLKALIQRIKNDVQLPHDFRVSYLSRLEPAYNAKTVEEYVLSQWKEGRNSRSELVGVQLATTAGPVAAIPFLWHVFNQLKF